MRVDNNTLVNKNKNKNTNLHVTMNIFDESYFHVTGGFLIEIVFMLSVSYFFDTIEIVATLEGRIHSI